LSDEASGVSDERAKSENERKRRERTFAERSREIGIALQAPFRVITHNEKTSGTSVITENSFRRSRSFSRVFARF
jgi:hypothetical protein